MKIEFFVTARGTQPWYRVAWGLHSASLGAFVIFGISAFALSGGGLVGLAVYVFFTGFPLILIAYMGAIIKDRSAEI
jgi:hypothetical protein